LKTLEAVIAENAISARSEVVLLNTANREGKMVSAEGIEPTTY
jgi:hypothetical protein